MKRVIYQIDDAPVRKLKRSTTSSPISRHSHSAQYNKQKKVVNNRVTILVKANNQVMMLAKRVRYQIDDADRGRTREELEQVDHVLPDLRITSQQPNVRVQVRSAGVVVTRADVHVRTESVFRRLFSPHHEHALRVRFEAHQAIRDIAASVLEALRKVYVARLVEARLELHEN